MLTKDLLRNQRRGGRIYPQWIDPQDEHWLALSETLLEGFQQAIGSTREDLLETSNSLISGMLVNNTGDLLIAKGLEKLLLDRTEFETGNEHLLAFRQRLLRYSSRLLSCPLAIGQWPEDRLFQQQLERYFKQPLALLTRQLYGDLPDLQKVLSFKPLSATALLHRYNCAQVQALLLHSEALTLTLRQPQTAQLRQLFQYLRFYQLLARLHKIAPDQYQLTIDGPLSLFYKTQKYGFNLAQFFPAILALPQWELQAQLYPGTPRACALHLDQGCGIQSHYQQFHAYIPPEIEWLQTRFAAKIADWVLSPAQDFIALGGEWYCFPDFTVTHPTGTMIHIELFHAWHSRALEDRLSQLQTWVTEGKGAAPLLLGITQRLAQTPALRALLDQSFYFQQYGFLFREMPTVEQIRPLLSKIQEERLSRLF